MGGRTFTCCELGFSLGQPSLKCQEILLPRTKLLVPVDELLILGDAADKFIVLFGEFRDLCCELPFFVGEPASLFGMFDATIMQFPDEISDSVSEVEEE